MAKIQHVFDLIRNFFNPTSDFHRERARKRRASNSFDTDQHTKYRRTQFHRITSDNSDRENYFVSPVCRARSSDYKFQTKRGMETIVLDDDDDDLKKYENNSYPNKSVSKYTSTPQESRKKYEDLAGCLQGNAATNTKKKHEDQDDDITFISELKSPMLKRNEASKLGLHYIQPFSSLLNLNQRIMDDSKNRMKRMSSSNAAHSSGSSNNNSNYSVRPDDKKLYRELLESSSEYSSALNSTFNFDTSGRKGRILKLAMDIPTREKMSTKDTIRKVLGDLENEPVVIKDSDSDSDVVFLNPPSPKPDFKVEPVNSFRKVVDTSQRATSKWLENSVQQHRKVLEDRKKEVEQLQTYADKHKNINKLLRVDLLADKVDRSLRIKEAILPVIELEESIELPELTDAQLKMVQRAFNGDKNEVLTKKFNLNITRRDILTLAGLNWLNDEVINFYMNMIIERGKDSKYPKSFAFNTFFYPKLIRDGAQSLRRWTKRVDLFEHDLICVPIHLGMHWCMAIIDFGNKSIRYYDSMGSKNDKCLEALRNYLDAEHMDKKKSHYDTSEFVLENVSDIPQQMNGSDCGMFSCTFAEFITRNAKITFNQEHMPYFRQKMVVEILTGELLIK
ncbi:unnamed protein product [Phyllotreta striolata]|uniref:Ubiquitin-like protease family profile domain-containing protein n=1 Tax=Phyllotreta striolata TaxID=444603 RepID=A0A9N9XS10_PHYSR|nr:unnamed protein product [Phyllotreta striolata]